MRFKVSLSLKNNFTCTQYEYQLQVYKELFRTLWILGPTLA